MSARELQELVALDGEVSNPTRAEKFKEKYPGRFFEMYVAEQNVLGTALGLSTRGKKPFVSTFAAFLTRAFDQIRMSQYSDAKVTFVGSHAGVSIGEDGPSQMGLEDLAMFRTLRGSTVLYPSDAVSTERLVEAAADIDGLTYLRMTRPKTPVLYDVDEQFPVGEAKTLRRSEDDAVTVVAAGYTVQEALSAYEELQGEDLSLRIIDLYSIKPLDAAALERAAQETGGIIVVEGPLCGGRYWKSGVRRAAGNEHHHGARCGDKEAAQWKTGGPARSPGHIRQCNSRRGPSDSGGAITRPGPPQRQWRNLPGKAPAPVNQSSAQCLHQNPSHA